MIQKGLMLSMIVGVAALLGSAEAGDAPFTRADAEQAMHAAEAAIDIARQRTMQPTRGVVSGEADERIHDAEIALRRAANRFGSGNFEGAVEHAEDAMASLDPDAKKDDDEQAEAQP